MTPKVGDVSGKTFLITGANCGLGYESMKAIMLGGGHVVMGCRTEERAKAAMGKVKEETKGKGSVEFLRLDLADLDSVREFAEQVKARHSSLYCLMNNAGLVTFKHQTTKQGFEMMIGTNHFGHFALTMQLLPLLKASKDEARVVNVTGMIAAWCKEQLDFNNIFAEGCWESQKVYGQSKLCNLLFHYELVRKLEGTNVKAVAAHPGICRTEFGRNNNFSWVRRACFKVVGSIVAQGSEKGATSQIQAATSPDVKSTDYIGPYWGPFGKPSPAEPPALALDVEAAKELWKLSEKLTGTEFPASN